MKDNIVIPRALFEAYNMKEDYQEAHRFLDAMFRYVVFNEAIRSNCDYPGDSDYVERLLDEANKDNVSTQEIVQLKMGDLKKAFEQWSSNTKSSSRNNEVLTINEVCTMLGCDKSSLWRWDKAGILKKKRAGGKVVYLRGEIMDFLKGKEKDI